MSRHIVLVVPGLDPVRILRVVSTLGGTDLVIPITRSAHHWSDDLATLLREIGVDPRIHWVEVDEWDFGAILQSLRDALGPVREQSGRFDVVIGGGTKPIAAAVGVVAGESDATTWVLDEQRGVLVAEEEVRLVEPALNLQPEGLARLYAVHHALPEPDRPDDGSLLRWLRRYLDGKIQGRGSEWEEISKTFESSVVALLRAVVADDHDVWGPQTFVLRDPDSPADPAPDPQASEEGSYRRFEVDGMVIRGTRMWVVETKARGKELTQSRMRTAYAELNRRRRDAGGGTATGVLIVLNDRQAMTTPEGPADPFTPAGIEVLGRADLVAALDALEAGDQEAVAVGEVARVFRMGDM